MDEFKKYLGVKFLKDSKTAIVPKSWVIKDSKHLNCFWPHMKHLKTHGCKDVSEMAQKNAAPEGWAKFPCQILTMSSKKTPYSSHICYFNHK